MGNFWRVTDSLVLLLVSTSAVLAAGAAEAGAAVAIVKIAGAAAEAATTLFNGIGLPAISIPIGLTKGKMPVAAQIIGPPFMDQTIMSMAYYYECRNDSLKMFIPPILS